MARLSVRFIATAREECIIRLSRLNPQMQAAENSEMKHMTYLIQHMIQRMVQRPNAFVARIVFVEILDARNSP